MAKKRILIVEDDKIMLEALRIEMEDAGYDVTAREDGESGLAEAMKGSYQLIVLDLMLPKMHGFDVLRALKGAKDARVRNVPIVILTNLTQDKEWEKGLKLGATDYCVKATTDLQGLKGKIGDLLSKS